jgi:hypothetical protein
VAPMLPQNELTNSWERPLTRERRVTFLGRLVGDGHIAVEVPLEDRLLLRRRPRSLAATEQGSPLGHRVRIILFVVAARSPHTAADRC